MSRGLALITVTAPVLLLGAIASGSARTKLVVVANDAQSRVQFVSDARDGQHHSADTLKK